MAWDSENGFTIDDFDTTLNKFYEAHKEYIGFTGTYEEYKQGKYGALFYGVVQQIIRSDTELSLLFEKTKDFYRTQNALIETNNLNPQGIQDVFKSELGYDVALGQGLSGFAIAIDYEPTEDANAKIAELLITECYTYGHNMLGDISQAYQKDEDSQSFVATWKQGVDTEIEYKIVITTVADNSAPQQTVEEIKSLFIELHDTRYTWGNRIQPQRLLTESDLDFATSVTVQCRRVTDPESEYQETPLTLEYYEKAIPTLSVNDISITEV